MADERDDATPTGAPLEDETSTTQDLRAALSRARIDDLPAEPDLAADLPSAASVQPAPTVEPDAFASALGASAAAASTPADTGNLGDIALPNESANMIQVSADHPMAQFYLNTPNPPEFKGNRGFGVLVALLAAVAYKLLFAGVISALLAPSVTMSEFPAALFEYLFSLVFIIPVATFLVSMIVLVLIVNRGGWWAYVFGSFFVGIAVWAGAAVGLALSPDLSDFEGRLDGLQNLLAIALLPISILAGIAAREVAIWFGAWIGAHGRKVKARNALALAEYEEALASSNTQPSGAQTLVVESVSEIVVSETAVPAAPEADAPQANGESTNPS